MFKKLKSARLVLGMATLCMALIVSSCAQNKNNDKKEAGKFPVVNPIVLDTLYTKEYVAEIQSFQNVELRARVSGYIEKIHIDEGATVKEGQLLFSLNGQIFREELLKAKAALKNINAELKMAKVELRNIKIQVEKNIVSATELEMAEAKAEAIEARVEEAKSNITTAQLNLSYTQIKAPFNGVINRIPNKVGSLVDEGELLTIISNNKEVLAYFNVSEKEYIEMAAKPGVKEVSLLLANNTPFKYTGVVETADNIIDKSTGNIAFRARFPNPEQLLKHGSSSKVLVKTRLENALLIPQKSTFEIQENLYVFVVGNDNTVSMRKITPAIRLEQLYVISSGLSAQDKIIYEGIQRVKDGDVIIPETISFSQIINR